jgi:hypothetical protein
MRAEDARRMMSNNRAIDYIVQALSQGKTSVEIPKQFVNREYLHSLGYKVIGGTHQRSETCNVSWERHWRD